jgi:hypothetical protein
LRQTQKGGEEKRKDAAVADADIRNSKEKAKRRRRRRRRARGRLYLESTRLAKANKHLVNRVIYIFCVCVS